MKFRYHHIIFILMIISVRLHGQDILDTRVTVAVAEVPFDSLIGEIKKETGISFSYYSGLFQSDQRFTVYKTNESLREVLDFVVLGSGITYGVFKGQVLFYRPEPQPAAELSAGGVVLDSLTGEGINNAHIYLDKTDIGTYTDIDGKFTLENVPEGTYDMVVSHISYGVYYYRMNLYKNESELEIRVMPKINVLPEIEITSLADPEEKRFIQLFKREVLGNTPKAKLCLINNPEDLYVYKDSAHFRNEFEIFAKRPISISNYWLGYNIVVDLIFFEVRKEQIVYIAKTNFRPMSPESGKVRKRWERNRYQTYLGSLRHFVASLENENKSRFRQKIVDNIPNELRFKYLPADIRSKDVINLITVIRNLEDGSFVEIYHPATQTVSYVTKTDFETNSEYKFELIKDYYDPKKGVMIYGTWATRRLAETLPLNYTVYSKKNLDSN